MGMNYIKRLQKMTEKIEESFKRVLQNRASGSMIKVDNETRLMKGTGITI